MVIWELSTIFVRMRIFKSIWQILNYKTLIVTVLSVASTWFCYNYQLTADFPLTLVGISIVFPIVFSISSAYNRRERALQHLASFKAHSVALHHASRDWIKIPEAKFEDRLKSHLTGLFEDLRKLFIAKREEQKDAELQIYKRIDSLSEILQEFRTLGLASSEMSRVDQFLSKMIIDLENMKMILHYRTPVTLRAYSKVFIYSFPILYGPYFAYTETLYAHYLEYVLPILFSFILVSLDNIQEHLENPFDQVGEDDVRLEIQELEMMMV